jgi:hypothetical protein
MSYNPKDYAAPGSNLQQQFINEDIEVAKELPSGVQIPIYQVKRVLTNDEVKALPTTPIILVPAQGENKIICAQSVYVFNNIVVDENGAAVSPLYQPGGLDSVPDDRLIIGYDSGNPICEIVNTDPGGPRGFGFAGLITARRIYNPPIPQNQVAYDAYWGELLQFGGMDIFTNYPVQVSMITANGNLTGGHAENKFIIVLNYYIVDLS